MESLMDIIGLRIATYFDEFVYNPTHDFSSKKKMFFSKDIFYKVVDCKYLDGISSWKYCLLHTHMRPRDIIVLLSSFRRAAEQAEKRIIDGSAINNGLYSYSQRKYQDIISSNKYRISGMNYLIDSFRTNIMVFTLNEIKIKLEAVIAKYSVQDLSAINKPHYVEWQKIVLFLYDAGFLVASSNAMGLAFVSHYIAPYYNILESIKIGIHPAFHKELMSGKGPMPVSGFLDSLNAK